MRCFICASVVTNSEESMDVDIDHGTLRTTLCRLLNITFSKYDSAGLGQVVFCLACKELIGLVDYLRDDEVQTDLNLLLQSFLDGYLNQLNREMCNDNQDCPFQSLRHEILKELEMVVEVSEDEGNVDSKDKMFRYNVISFDNEQQQQLVEASIEMKYHTNNTYEVEDVEMPILIQQQVLPMDETTPSLSLNNVASLSTSSSCTVRLENVNADSSSSLKILTGEAKNNVISEAKTSRRSRRKPLKPIKGILALDLEISPPPSVSSQPPIVQDQVEEIKEDVPMPQLTNEDGAITCGVCGKGFQSVGRLERHKKIHNAVKPVKCDLCPKTFRTRQYLDIHKKNHPPPSTELNRFSCDSCTATFSHLCTLREHQRTHTGELPYSCKICGEKFAFTSRLKRHESVKHSDQKKYKCRFCDKSFKQPGNLKSHENRHDKSKKTFKCPQCPLTFFDDNKLKYHVTVHTGEKPFVCSESNCGKAFRLKAALKLHVANVHFKVKNHVCEVCNRRFSQRQYLNYHLTTHPELDKPRFICEEPGCGKSFAEPSSLREHGRKHTGDFRFQCDYCPAKFVFKSRYERHMRTHSDSKDCQCIKCKKYFSSKASLRRHMENVHGKKSEDESEEEYVDDDDEDDDYENDA